MEIVNPKASQFHNLSQSLLTLPGFVFWKDIEGHYLGCNDSLVEFLNMSSNKDIQGKTDLSFSWGRDHQLFRAHDNQVQRQKQASCFVEPTLLANQKMLNLLAVKSPLISLNGQVAGVIGVSISLEDKELNETLEQLLKISEEVQLILEPGPMVSLMTQIMKINACQNQWQSQRPLFDYGWVAFSFREAQCLHYFFNHYSAQKTSEKIHISKKTVEFHLAKIKEKLNCHDMSKISNLAVDYGFIDLMFMKF